MLVGLAEDDAVVTLSHIAAEDAGTGTGTALVEALRDYVDDRGLTFRVANSVRDPYWERFPWLERVAHSDGMSTFEYRPARPMLAGDHANDHAKITLRSLGLV